MHNWLNNHPLWELFFICLIAVVSLIVFIPLFTYFYFVRDLTSRDMIINRSDTGLVLLDRSDRPFFTFYQGRVKETTPLSQISLSMQQAVIASEDREFYAHPGFSLPGIARSILLDTRSGQLTYGGSTITQQLVKNTLLTSEKSFLRKYQEIVLAAEIERRYSKNEILEMYLNSIYFGEGAFGIEEAAQMYFGIHANELTLAQSSLLTGLLTSPSALSPLTNDPLRAKARQQIVLNRMVEQGYITKATQTQAYNTPLVYKTVKSQINAVAPHFALMVRDELIKRYGEEFITRSGFRVKTTIDLDFQKFAETAVHNQVTRLVGDKVTNGAAVVIDPTTNEIRALVGSYNWFDEKFGTVNMALSPRQPGSSFKPLVYAAAFEDHVISPSTLLQDKKTTFPGNYTPKNFDNSFWGPMLPRFALANSRNIPAVWVMDRLGVDRVLMEVSRFGITTLTDPSKYGLSLVLGSGDVPLVELTNAYAAFANGGLQGKYVDILEITDKRGDRVYTVKPSQQQVISAEVAFIISSILSDNRARAQEFGNALTLSRPAAVKTGTTEDFRDALTIGYTPQVVVGVWIGNNDNKSMDRIAGSLGAAPVWRVLMEQYLAGKPVLQFVKPSGLTQLTICRENGFRARQATASAYIEYFLSGTEPLQSCDSGVSDTAPTIQVTQEPLPTQEEASENTETPEPSPTSVEFVPSVTP